jgi:hypothetical protein
MNDEDIADYMESVSVVIRAWKKAPLQRHEVLRVLGSVGLAEEDAVAVLEDGLAKGVLRQDEDGIRAVERPDC